MGATGNALLYVPYRSSKLLFGPAPLRFSADIRATLVAREILAILGLRHQDDFEPVFFGLERLKRDFEGEALVVDSLSALRIKGAGRVETKEAASSVLLASTYGRG